jgi:glycine cleavage system regulatory protein
MTEQNVLVITVIGDDRPGLVGELSATITAHQGNWLESSMAHLAGKFAGIVKVAVPRPQAEALKSGLSSLSGLKVTAECSAETPLAGRRRLRLSLVGHDRIGIVKEVTQVLARHAVNVEELTTHVSSAPMSAETLFHANAELSAATTLDSRILAADLERISNDLMVDISVDETIA